MHIFKLYPALLLLVIASSLLYAGTSGTTEYDTQGSKVKSGTGTDQYLDQDPQIDTQGLTAPPPRAPRAMSYDPLEQVIVLFGGTQSGGQSNLLGDTWEFDLRTGLWSEINTTVSPSARYSHDMVYDAHLKAHIMAAGHDGSSNLYDTWLYFANNNTWLQVQDYPQPTVFQSMTYMEDAGKTVALGGGGSSTYSDFFEYDRHSGWTSISYQGAPAPIPWPYTTYDTVNNVLISFGGWNGTGSADTHSYHYGNSTWIDPNPAGEPPARSHHSIVYNQAEKKVVVFGGYNGSNNYFSDLWSYDYKLNQWDQVSKTTPLGKRIQTAFVYEPTTAQIISFGGHNGTNYLNDLWAYDLSSNTWNPLKRGESFFTQIRLRHKQYFEDFDTDVISNGIWNQSDPSVTVDTTNSVLDIAPGGGYNDMSFGNIPNFAGDYAIEYSSVLISGGANYGLPYIRLVFEDGYFIIIGYTYQGSGAWGWIVTDNSGALYSSSNTNTVGGPTGENQWWDVKLLLSSDQLQIHGKSSSSAAYVPVLNQSVTINSPLDLVSFEQPWDAHIQVNWISVTSLNAEYSFAYDYKATFSGHASRVLGTSWYANQSVVVTGGEDMKVRFWNPETGTQIHEFTPVGITNWVYDTQLSPDGRYLAVTSRNGQLWLYHANNLSQISYTPGYSAYLEWSPDSQYIALKSGGETGSTVAILDPISSTVVATIAAGAQVSKVKWSPDMTFIAVTALSNTMKVFYTANYTQYLTKTSSGWLLSVDWTSDGQMFAVGGKDAQITVYDRQGTQQYQFSTAGEVSTIDFHPVVNDVLAYGDGNSPYNAYVTKINGSILAELNATQDIVYNAKWNQYGDRIILTSRDGNAYTYYDRMPSPLLDRSAPELKPLGDVTFLAGSNSTLTWQYRDDSVVTYKVLVNSSLFTSGEPAQIGFIKVDLAALADGIYNVTLTVTDSYGNSATDTVIVTISTSTTTTPTTTNSTTPDTTTSSTTPATTGTSTATSSSDSSTTPATTTGTSTTSSSTPAATTEPSVATGPTIVPFSSLITIVLSLLGVITFRKRNKS